MTNHVMTPAGSRVTAQLCRPDLTTPGRRNGVYLSGIGVQKLCPNCLLRINAIIALLRPHAHLQLPSGRLTLEGAQPSSSNAAP